MKKPGITLIELIVAMAIFLIIVTIVVGAFTTVARMKSLTSTMNESQQKTRIALEMITRLSRQAQKVITKDTNNDTLDDTLDLYFNIQSENPLGARFEITSNNELMYSECEDNTLNCATWSSPTNLYENINLDYESSFFKKDGTIPPTLSIELHSSIGEIENNPYYSDELNIVTTVVLESIK